MMKNTTEAVFGRFDYGALNISAKKMKALEESAADIQALGRRSTQQAYDLSVLLEKASQLVEPGTFEKWVAQRCDISSKTARNYRSVARNLEAYRERAIELAISPTVLFHLAYAPEEKVEAALAHAEEHGGIRVSEVKGMLSDGSEETAEAVTSVELADVGGLSGLRALIDVKTKSGIAAFVESAVALVAEVSKILESKPEGKRLQKTSLIPVLEPLARAAKRSLGNILLLDVPGDIDVRKISERELPGASHWHKVFKTLDHLGNRESWPEVKRLEAWLQHEVLQLLDWATSRTKRPDWPLAAPTLEGQGHVIGHEAASFEASGDEDEALTTYVPPTMFAGIGGTLDDEDSNILSFGPAERRTGLRTPKSLMRKPAEASVN